MEEDDWSNSNTGGMGVRAPISSESEDHVPVEDIKSSVVYVGRIPHGFYEKEMMAYFSQFGDISRLKLSRNKKTGKSKHYAFIEFKNPKVAEIVAETMDNYLLYNHILQVKVIPSHQIHENMFSKKKFKVIPWASIARERNDRERTEEEIEKLKKREEIRRLKRAEKLKALNLEF